MHLSKWCKCCCNITVTQDAATEFEKADCKSLYRYFPDYHLESFKQMSFFSFSPKMGQWKIFQLLFFFSSPHGNTHGLIVKSLLFVCGNRGVHFFFFSSLHIIWSYLCFLLHIEMSHGLSGLQARSSLFVQCLS